MKMEFGLRKLAALIGIAAFVLMSAVPSGFAYSSKEAKEKVEAAEKALQDAQRADDRAEKAADDWTKKADQDIRDSLNAQKKRDEADAAREKANQTGENKDIKAAEKAEKIADAAEKKAGESKKAFEAALQAYEQARAQRDAAKAQVPPLIESAEKEVEGLPETSVKKKLKERIKKLKEALQQLAFAFPTELDPGKVRVSIAGTKETIGHVATLTLINRSDEAFFIRIPPTILASKTGKVQNYGLTETVETTLAPGETKAIPLTGICLDARVRPAGPEDKDELALLNPETLDRNWRIQLGGTQAVIQTTEELQRQGIYKTPYSKQPQKERDTIVQWTTWLFVSTLKGNPVTKEDLKKKVYEQVDELTPEKKEKLDLGVDDLWTAIKLTGAEAKVFSEGTEKISATAEDELEALKKKTQAQKPLLPQPPVVNPPPAAGIVGAEQPAGPPQGPCGFFEKELLRTVETPWRPKGGSDFALPGRDPAVIVVWEKDIENEFKVTGRCPLAVGHDGDHVPVEKIYEKVKTVTQEESYPPGTKRPKPPKGLGLPQK